jgi:hypothetical protein
MAPEPKPIVQRLIYKAYKNGTVKFFPQNTHLKKGNKVTFVCDQGTLNLWLEPKDAWDRRTFRTGGRPVLVKRPKGKIWCGGTFTIKTIRGDSTTVKINPKKKLFGSQNGPPPDT